MKCAECGSEDILADAYARWNVELQDWELSAVFTDKGCFCNNCEEECDIEEEEV